MSAHQAFRFDPRAVAGSFALGVASVVLFPSMSGSVLGPSAGRAIQVMTVPMLGMATGFLLTGIGYGYLSERETVLEPALAAALVSVPAYFILVALDLEAFAPLVEVGSFTYAMVLVFLNGLVLTFVGAWVGELLQGTYKGPDKESVLAWRWIAAGTVLGLAVSLCLANLVIWLFGAFGPPIAALEPQETEPLNVGTMLVGAMLVAVSLGLVATGYVCAFCSPGETRHAAAIAGVITVVLLIDALAFALGGRPVLSYIRIGQVLVLGLAGTFVGGALGERAQARREEQTHRENQAREG